MLLMTRFLTTNKRYKLYREFIYAPQSRYMRLLDRYISARIDTANGADCNPSFSIICTKVLSIYTTMSKVYFVITTFSFIIPNNTSLYETSLGFFSVFLILRSKITKATTRSCYMRRCSLFILVYMVYMSTSLVHFKCTSSSSPPTMSAQTINIVIVDFAIRYQFL